MGSVVPEDYGHRRAEPMSVKLIPAPDGGVGVLKAINAVQRDMPAIGKDDRASAGGGENYAYRGIEAITRHVQQIAAQHGLVIVPQAEVLATVPSPAMRDGWQDTIMRVEWALYGLDGSHLIAVTNGVGRDKSDKGANKAQTQAFKYLLLHVLCIADAADDSDGKSYEDERRPEQQGRHGRGQRGRNASTQSAAPQGEAAITPATVARGADAAFSAFADDVPRGHRTRVKEYLRHALVYACTKGEKASLKACTPQELKKVQSRVLWVASGNMTVEADVMDPAAGVRFASNGSAATVLWAEVAERRGEELWEAPEAVSA